MLRKVTTCWLMTATALMSPAWAQTTDQATDPAEATQTDGAGETPAQLDLGEPVEQGPRIGERYLKENFSDWDLVCIKSETDTDPCSMLQILTDNTNNPVAEVSLFRLENGGQAVAGATVVVPLETLLTAQLTISVDGGTAKRYSYSFCNQIGCVAQIGLTQADVDAFKRGNEAVVSLRPAPAPDQIISLPMSLSGFTAAFDAVDVVAN